MNYYEVLFDDEYGICIKGIKQPTIKEAEEFCKIDMEKYEVNSVVSVDPISYSEACNFYDMENEEKFPVFGE